MSTDNTLLASFSPIVPAKDEWTKVIEPRTRLLDLRLRQLWRYRDLVLMFVRRDFVANFKQTILGPLWFFIQPLLTTLTYVVIFGRVAKLSTDGLPMLLFYLAGVTIWNFFSETLNKTAVVFKENEHLFGKVYFPRLVMPVSIVLSKLMRFILQFTLFLSVWAYYYFQTDAIRPNALLLLTPVLIAVISLLALGLGMIISAMTTKYKDLTFLLSFGLQLFMFATPVIYPASSVPDQYQWLVMANPVSAIIETFRFGFLGSGTFNPLYLSYSILVSMAILAIGVLVFNKVEKSFTDVV